MLQIIIFRRSWIEFIEFKTVASCGFKWTSSDVYALIIVVKIINLFFSIATIYCYNPTPKCSKFTFNSWKNYQIYIWYISSHEINLFLYEENPDIWPITFREKPEDLNFQIGVLQRVSTKWLSGFWKFRQIFV